MHYTKYYLQQATTSPDSNGGRLQWILRFKREVHSSKSSIFRQQFANTLLCRSHTLI